MRIIVVRHGQAEPKKGWTGPDDLRPLTSRGRRQADRLDKVLGAGTTPARILTSPALRCEQTVQPIAERCRIGLERTEALATDAGAEATALCRKLANSEPSDSVVILCTHREAMLEMLPQLGQEFGHKLGHRLPGAKGGAWFLDFQEGRLAKVDYRPPAA